MCRRPFHELYHKSYITEANIRPTRTLFPTNIKIKVKFLPRHWSAFQHDGIKREMLTIRLFILTALYITSFAVSFLFFISFCSTRCIYASSERYVHLKSGEDKTLSEIIFSVVSVWLFLELSCPQNTVLQIIVIRHVTDIYRLHF